MYESDCPKCGTTAEFRPLREQARIRELEAALCEIAEHCSVGTRGRSSHYGEGYADCSQEILEIMDRHAEVDHDDD